jgi:hypothetical protein
MMKLSPEKSSTKAASSMHTKQPMTATRDLLSRQAPPARNVEKSILKTLLSQKTNPLKPSATASIDRPISGARIKALQELYDFQAVCFLLD